MTVTRIYLRASTTDQDALRAEQILLSFIENNKLPDHVVYSENISGTKLNRPELNRLLNESNAGDILLIESVDRLSRLSMDDWDSLKYAIKQKGLRLVVEDLPTTHQQFNNDDITSSIMTVINDMLIDLLATMARLDQQKRVERIQQGQERAKAKYEDNKLPTRGKDKALRDNIIEIMNRNTSLKANEVADLAKCGVATVYRVKKELKESTQPS